MAKTDTSLTVQYVTQNGTSASRAYTYINPAANDQQLRNTAQAIIGLTNNTLVKVNKIERTDLDTATAPTLDRIIVVEMPQNTFQEITEEITILQNNTDLELTLTSPGEKTFVFGQTLKEVSTYMEFEQNLVKTDILPDEPSNITYEILETGYTFMFKKTLAEHTEITIAFPATSIYKEFRATITCI